MEKEGEMKEKKDEEKEGGGEEEEKEEQKPGRCVRLRIKYGGEGGGREGGE